MALALPVLGLLGLLLLVVLAVAGVRISLRLRAGGPGADRLRAGESADPHTAATRASGRTSWMRGGN